MNSAFTNEVAGRFGILPNFFCTAPAAAGLIEELWAFAKSAYLDSPLPPLFKERLFVHLSRFCEVRYCIVRHVGFLMGHGRPAGDASATPHTLEQTLTLLRRPIPDASALEQVFTRLGAHAGPDDLPSPETQAEADLFDALTIIFLVPQRSARARSNVRLGFGDRTFELLTAFLAFVRTAHYWTETHPELAYEPDMLDCMDLHPDLAALLLEPGEAAEVSPTMQLGKVLGDLGRAEGALRESETRQRALIEGIPQLVWRATYDGRRTWVSPQWCIYTGQSEDESLGFGWLGAIHPDDRETASAAWRSAPRTGRLELEGRICNVAEQRCRWFQTRATPVRNEAGAIIEWLGTSTDVDDLRHMQERQGVLVKELQHRTRNLLGVVNAIARQTVSENETTKGFENAFMDRLSALSRVQGLLSRADADPITLDAVLRMELDALGAAQMQDRILVHGPKVRLRKRMVETLSLALHELATNARKYGALTALDGQLRVTWRTYTDGSGQRLALEWQENGLDHQRQAQSPTTEPGGYGRELIEQALPYVLQARTTYDLGPTGLCCTIDLPLTERNDQQGDHL